MRGTDTAATTTKAIPIGQGDLAGNTKGIGAYTELFLHVSAPAPIASLGVTLETSDTETGTYETAITYPTKTTIKAGDTIVKARLPRNVRNWVRLKFTAAAAVNAHLAIDTDKRFPEV